jgi:hypothetical protein
MEDNATKLVEEKSKDIEPRQNRGWFQAGDQRINHRGRPKGSKKSVPPGSHPSDCAQKAGRVKRIFVGMHQLRNCLVNMKGPWIINLPHGIEIVDCRVDEGRGGVFFTIRSELYPLVAKGTLIPEFPADYNGLVWCR